MALADSCDPDENSRLLRNLFVMTFTWDPPTSLARTIFDIPLFVRFLMMPYPGVDLEIVRADVIGNSCSLSARRRNPPRLKSLLAGRFDVHRCRRDIASVWREASVRPQLGCQK